MATGMRHSVVVSAAVLAAIVLGSWRVAEGVVTKAQLVAAMQAVNPSYDGTLTVNATDAQGNMTNISFSSSAAVSNISPLAGLPLTKLTLPANKQLTDLSALSGMPLQTLNMGGTGVTNLGPLSGCPLTSLTIGDTSITDLSPLQGMHLTNFDCMRDRVISDLSPLYGMPLTNFGCYGCYNIKDITPLSHAQLKSVNFENSSVADLSPLHGQPISSARICTAYITDLTPLIGMPMQSLDITYANKLTDISPILNMTAMTDYRMDQVIASDLTAIRNMTNLKTLSILACPNIHDLSIIQHMNITAFIFTSANFSPAQMAILRSTTSLKWIAEDWSTWNNNAQNDSQQTCQTAAQFWAKYDAAHPGLSSYIFYNNSAFDGNDPSASAADDAAIAIDKGPVMPGHTATLSNYTSYSKGINGVMFDIPAMPGTPTTSDFTIKKGNSNTPTSWTTVAVKSSYISVRRGVGVNGTDRVTLTLPDGLLCNTWVQFTVKASANTGLSTDQVLYYGNAPGETGNSSTSARVDTNDVSVVRADPHKSIGNPAPITDMCDFNRDKKITTADEIMARQNITTVVNELKLVTVP